MSVVHPLQLTLAILKPDLLMRPLAACAVRERIVREGFHVVRSAVVRWSREDAEKFYSDHKDKFFYDRLVTYMSSGPLNPLILGHSGAIARWREVMGPTKSYQARLIAPHSIRGTFGLSDTQNSTHGSDSEKSVKREVKFLFPDFSMELWYQKEEPEYRNVIANNSHESNREPATAQSFA